nr:hypothetical protein [Tanacetum cinerariifolium]
MSGQTRSSVGVDEETRESLRDTIALLMRKELEKLRDEMRKCSRVTHVEFPRFRGDDVKGWLFKSEEFFKVNNIPDESKVKFISTHLYDIALKWHNQFLGIMRGQVDWVLYKESALLRFGQNKKFMSDNVKDSSCGLHVIDKVGDLLEFFVNKKQEEDFDKIKRDIKHESVKELVDGSNGLVEDKLLASNCCSFGQGYVHTAETMVEYILATKLLFDPGGKRVCDLGGSHGRNVFGKHAIETNCKSRILVVVTSYVWLEKSLLGLKEYEFGGVREMVPRNISKHGMGGNEPVLNDIFVDIVDKLTNKRFKISTFMETQVGYLCIRLWLGLYGYQICLKTFSLEKVLEYSERIREPVRYKVHKGIKENEFVPEKEKAFEILESEFVMELMLITNMCDKPFESMSRSCECCYSQWSYVVVIEFVWKGDSWPMKSGVNCVIIVSVQGVSQLNHLDSCQSMVEEEEPEADIKVHGHVDTKVPGPVLKIVDNELVPEIVSKLIDTKADIEEKLGSQSHTTSFSDLGFSDS